MVTILVLGVVACVLFAIALVPKRGSGAPGAPLFAPAIVAAVSRPSASAWSKQTAADMLDEIARADERARVIETLRRAVAANSPGVAGEVPARSVIA